MPRATILAITLALCGSAFAATPVQPAPAATEAAKTPLAAAQGLLAPLPPEQLAVDPAGPIEVIVGQTKQLKAKGGQGPYTWTTLNPAVGTVDAYGLFTAVGKGPTKTTQVLVTDATSHVASSGTITVPYDSDGDGLPDAWEQQHGLDIGKNDAGADGDGDGAPDAVEWANGCDPTKADSDADGMPDGWEIDHGLAPLTPDGTHDPDGDGLDNLREYLSDHDPFASDAGVDTDGDGMDDVWEILNGLDLADPTDAGADPDGDGLASGIERLTGTDPHLANDNLPDTDGDWIPDVWEAAWGTDPTTADHAVDADGDGFPHYLEYLLGTDPFGHNGALTDSDGDGMPDYWERTYGLDPSKDDAAKDADADGRPNRVEYRDATHPKAKDGDVDGDGMGDGWEHGFALTDPLGNPDNDQLTNVDEYHKGKNPLVLDPYTMGVDPSTVALVVGETVTLACTNGIGPCTWTIDAPDVASVGGGLVTALLPGVAIVTGRDANDTKALCVVAVREVPGIGELEPVGVQPPTTDLVEGGSQSFAAFGGERPYASILSSDDLIVAVKPVLDGKGALSGTGALVAGHAGDATVTVTDAQGGIATIAVHVTAGVVTISPKTLSLEVGETAGIWASGASPFAFASEGPSVATVNPTTGIVTGVAAGTTRVIATDAYGRDAAIPVTVANPVLSIAPEELTLGVGAGVELLAIGGIPPYVWTSDDEAVVSVTKQGHALAVLAGEARVTVTDAAGQKATATLNVTAATSTDAAGCAAGPPGSGGPWSLLVALVLWAVVRRRETRLT